MVMHTLAENYITSRRRKEKWWWEEDKEDAKIEETDLTSLMCWLVVGGYTDRTYV